LKKRWDRLRSQLHGVVILPGDAIGEDVQKFIKELEQSSPNFSPTWEAVKCLQSNRFQTLR
jgi:hypothetical protein